MKIYVCILGLTRYSLVKIEYSVTTFAIRGHIGDMFACSLVGNGITLDFAFLSTTVVAVVG